MRIEWRIDKQRGNLRPVLRYTVSLEPHEKALAVPPVRVQSTIPEPPDSWRPHCYPGESERAGEAPKGVYVLDAPSHAGREAETTLRLPWREDNAYPEVEASFALLRDACEAQLTSAHASEPMTLRGELRATESMRRHVAPAVVAERLLRLAR